MTRYNEYKDSGVQWLGEIPSHWDMQRWRFLLTENKIKNTDCKEKVQLQFKYGDIVRKANQDEDADVLETISKYTVVAPDDIMINGLNLNYDFISQRVAQVRENGVITSAYVSLRPTPLAHSRYYTYFLKSMDFKKMFHGMGTGIRLTLSYNELKNQFIPFPSIKEQQAIAAYLDEQTAKIDTAIAQQQKMIDLLNERKQIIINNAVTKGLNPNVKMKDSGVEWIGEMPEHWEMKRLKSILSVKDKRNANPEALLLSVYTAIGVRPRQELEERGNKASTVINYKIVSKGDLIVNRLLAWMGAYGLSNYDGVTSPDYDVYSFHADVNRGYYETLFRNTQFKSDCYKYGHGIMMMRWRTYSDEFLSINVPIPPKQEQDAIFDYLKPQIDKIEDSIEQCNKMLALLQERKQIIINDVVTGKVKV